MNKKHEFSQECDCIFCNSKCPKCGSLDIEVNFKLGFSYINDTKDSINLDCTDEEIELECNTCGERITGGSYREDRRLDALLSGLIIAINLPDSIASEIDQDGNISYRQIKFVNGKN
jgi:hypothetical protein